MVRQASVRAAVAVVSPIPRTGESLGKVDDLAEEVAGRDG